MMKNQATRLPTSRSSRAGETITIRLCPAYRRTTKSPLKNEDDISEAKYAYNSYEALDRYLGGGQTLSLYPDLAENSLPKSISRRQRTQ